MFQSGLWTLHCRGSFHSAEKLVVHEGFLSSSPVIHFQTVTAPHQYSEGSNVMPRGPWISDLGPRLLHDSPSLLFMFAARSLHVFFRGTGLEVQGQQNGVDLLFSGLREAKTSSMWSEIWGSPIELSSAPQTGLLIHKETKALQGAWTLGVSTKKG